MSHGRTAEQAEKSSSSTALSDTSLAAGEREAGVNGVYHAWHVSLDGMDCQHNLGPPEVPLKDASLGDCGRVTEKVLLPSPAAHRAIPPSTLPHNPGYSTHFKAPQCSKPHFL